jgi:hypothetical protein
MISAAAAMNLQLGLAVSLFFKYIKRHVTMLTLGAS